ncbi:nitrate/nitrite transporter NrtS [Colwelliaceae bacterium BS250]
MVSVIVGSTLLFINQFNALFGQSSIRIIPALLTYCVPFIVFLLGNRSNTKNKGK